MLAAIGDIRADVEGMTAEALASDRKTRSAVLFGLIVIGEAATAIPDEVDPLDTPAPWVQSSPGAGTRT